VEEPAPAALYDGKNLGPKGNSRFSLTVPTKIDSTITQTQFEFSTEPHRFADKLRQVGMLLPELIGELTGTATIEGEEEEELHSYTVTNIDILDKLIYSFDEITDFIFAGQASALYDGSCVLEYQKADGTWTTLSTITGDGANAKQSIADASLLVGDNVENPAKFPFVLQIRVAVKATAGTCGIWIKTE
jgi:hypothetical protein